MHYRVLFIGNENQLEKQMKMFCDECGYNELKKARCDYYEIEDTILKQDIGQIGGNYYAIIKNGRWYERKAVPKDYYLKGGYKTNPKYKDIDWKTWTTQEHKLWDKRAKGLLNNVDETETILVLDVHN